MSQAQITQASNPFLDKLSFSRQDVQTPFVKILQSNSQAVGSGKISGEYIGSIYRTDTNKIFAVKDTDFQFQVLWFVKQIVFRTYEGNKIGESMGIQPTIKINIVKLIEDPEHKDYNANQISKDGIFNVQTNTTEFAEEQIVFFILPFSGGKFEDPPSPCQIICSSTNMRFGRKLIGLIYSYLLGNPNKAPYNIYFSLRTKFIAGDKGSYFVFDSPVNCGAAPEDFVQFSIRASDDCQKLLKQNSMRLTADEPVNAIDVKSVQQPVPVQQPVQQIQQPVQQIQQPVQPFGGIVNQPVQQPVQQTVQQQIPQPSPPVQQVMTPQIQQPVPVQQPAVDKPKRKRRTTKKVAAPTVAQQPIQQPMQQPVQQPMIPQGNPPIAPQAQAPKAEGLDALVAQSGNLGNDLAGVMQDV